MKIERQVASYIVLVSFLLEHSVKKFKYSYEIVEKKYAYRKGSEFKNAFYYTVFYPIEKNNVSGFWLGDKNKLVEKLKKAIERLNKGDFVYVNGNWNKSRMNPGIKNSHSDRRVKKEFETLLKND